MEKELADIRKEIIEARNLVIKNDNLLKNLGTDLKQVAKKQEAFERKQWISSGVAYLTFAALSATVAFLGAQGYVAAARSEVTSLTEKAESATSSASAAREELEAMREASKLALSAYTKLDAGTPEEREQAVTALQKVDRAKLSRLEARALEDRGREIIQTLATEKLESGRRSYLRQDFAAAAADLKKAVALWPDHPSADEYAFYLGSAALETRDFPTAVSELQRFVEKAEGRKNKDYAHLLLGRAYDAVGQKDKAQAALIAGIEGYPASQFIRPMRYQLSQIRKAATASAE